MKQKFFLILFFLLFFLLEHRTASVAMAFDVRAQKITAFLEKSHSPLVYFANDFVTEADRNGLDYRLLVSISGVESTFGQNYISGTFNAYGWGGGEIPFNSWPDGIKTVSEGLKKGYVDKGAKDIDQIALIYCPPSSTSWSAKVRQFMARIEAEDPSDYLPPSSPASNQLALTL